jgi:hypothetical protein
LGEVLKKKWKNKVMHGQYIRNMDRQFISEEDTFLRLSKGDLKAETESGIVASSGIIIYPIQEPGRRYKMHHTHDNGERRQPSLGNCFGYAAYHPRWMFGNWTFSGK